MSRTVPIVLVLALAGIAAPSRPLLAQCGCLTPGSGPPIYRITFSNGMVGHVKQVQPTPKDGNGCWWTGAADVGRTALFVIHSGDNAAAPVAGATGKIPSVWLGIDTFGAGDRIVWFPCPAAAVRDGKGPFVVMFPGGSSAKIEVGP